MPMRQSTDNNDSRNKSNNVNLGPVMVDGLYKNGDMVKMLTYIHGRETKVLTTDGETIEGVFSSASENCEIAVRLASEESKKGKGSLLTLERDITDKMKISKDSIVCMTFELKPIKDSHNFATDLDYSKKYNGRSNDFEDKEFVEWDDGDVEDGIVDDHMPPQDKNHYSGKNKEIGWSVDDMFKKNNDLGVKSTFEGSEALYTTVEVVGNSEDRQRAEELAREIESNVESKKAAELENDDEEKNIVERKPVIESNDVRNQKQQRSNGNQRGQRNGPMPNNRGSGLINKNIDNHQNSNVRSYGVNRDSGRYQPPQKQFNNPSPTITSTNQSQQQTFSQQGQTYGNKFDNNKSSNMSGNRSLPRNNSGTLNQNNSYNNRQSNNQESSKGIIQRSKELNNPQIKKDGDRKNNFDNNKTNSISSTANAWSRGPPTANKIINPPTDNSDNQGSQKTNKYDNNKFDNTKHEKKDYNNTNENTFTPKKDKEVVKGNKDVHEYIPPTNNDIKKHDNNKNEIKEVKEVKEQEVKKKEDEDKKSEITDEGSSINSNSSKGFKFNVDAPAFVPSTVNPPSSPSNMSSTQDSVATNPPQHIQQQFWYSQPHVFQGGQYVYAAPHGGIQGPFYPPYPPQHPTGMNPGNPQMATLVVNAGPIPMGQVNQGSGVVPIPVPTENTNQSQGNIPPAPISTVGNTQPTIIHPQPNVHYNQHNMHPPHIHHPNAHRYDNSDRRDKKPKGEYRNKDRDYRDHHVNKRDERYNPGEQPNIPQNVGYPNQMIQGYAPYPPYGAPHMIQIPCQYFPPNNSINQQSIPPVSTTSPMHYQMPQPGGIPQPAPQQQGPVNEVPSGVGYNNNQRQGNQNTGSNKNFTGDNISNDGNIQRHSHSPDSATQSSRPESPKIHRSSPTLSTTSQQSFQPQMIPYQQYVMPNVCPQGQPINVVPGQGGHFNMAYQHPQPMIPGNNMVYYQQMIPVPAHHYPIPRRNSIPPNSQQPPIYNNPHHPPPVIHHQPQHQPINTQQPPPPHNNNQQQQESTETQQPQSN